MSYDDLRGFAETYGLVYLVILFLIAVAYAFWPRNRKKFEAAARIPLQED